MSSDGKREAIQVVVVAPAMVAWGLERMLDEARTQFQMVGSAGTLAQAQQLLQERRVDVSVVDLDGGYGSQAIAEVRAWTTSSLVALTSSSDKPMLDGMVVAGVRGIVHKSDPPSALLKALEKVHEGELWIDRGAAGRIFMELARRRPENDPERLKIATLTARERQTIVAVATDSAAPGKVIAGRLCISEHTLRNHLSAIYAKLGLVNRVDLYAYATRHHLDRMS